MKSKLSNLVYCALHSLALLATLQFHLTPSASLTHIPRPSGNATHSYMLTSFLVSLKYQSTSYHKPLPMLFLLLKCSWHSLSHLVNFVIFLLLFSGHNITSPGMTSSKTISCFFFFSRSLKQHIPLLPSPSWLFNLTCMSSCVFLPIHFLKSSLSSSGQGP